MTRVSVALLGCLVLVGCARQPRPSDTGGSLVEARKGFQTKLSRKESAHHKVTKPPKDVFRLVQYDAAPGKMAAYLTPDPKDGRKHPAIVWITGGDCNTIDDVWSPAPAKNDQTAAVYRQGGVVMMFPSLRGGNENPGVREGFLGEVDDVIAAADYLAKQDYVDPKRIYLGGHSTGGTLVLLVAECTDKFRAVFSFGPVDDPSGYGDEFTPFSTSDRSEVDLRSPGRWLHCIRTPVFVMEGANDGNIRALRSMAKTSTNPKVHFVTANKATHFSILAPVNRLLTDKVLHDTGDESNITVTEDEVNKLLFN